MFLRSYVDIDVPFDEAERALLGEPGA